MTARSHVRKSLRSVAVFLVLAVGAASCGTPPEQALRDPDRPVDSIPARSSGQAAAAQSTTSVQDSLQDTSNGVAGRATVDGDFDIEFAILENGGYRIASERETAVYDPTTLVLQIDSDRGTTVVIGMPPSGPDVQHAYLLSYLRFDTRAWAVEAAARGDSTTGDRIGLATEEWSGSAATSEGSLDLTIAVEPETGIPIHVSQARDGEDPTTWDIAMLSATDKVATDLGIRFDQATHQVDRGFTLVSLEKAEELAGYPTPTPGWLPTGFELASVAFAVNPQSDVNALNPPSENVVIKTYRRWGFDTLTITTRVETVEYLRGDSGEIRPWTDPYCIGQPCEPTATHDALNTTFQVVAGPLATTHAWGIANDVVVTVGGEITLDQLRAVLDSLKTTQ